MLASKKPENYDGSWVFKQTGFSIEFDLERPEAFMHERAVMKITENKLVDEMRPERFITGLAGANNELDLAWGLK